MGQSLFYPSLTILKLVIAEFKKEATEQNGLDKSIS
jgi:hypothetical protein